jgi:hypothetical protein
VRSGDLQRNCKGIEGFFPQTELLHAALGYSGAVIFEGDDPRKGERLKARLERVKKLRVSAK